MSRGLPFVLFLLLWCAVFAFGRAPSLAAEPSARDCIALPDDAPAGTSHVAYGPLSQNSQPGIARACLLAEHAAGLVKMDQARDAEREFDEALAIAPNDAIRSYVGQRAAQAFSAKGGRHDDAQEWDLAVVAYTLALRYDPNDPGTYGSRAAAHERKLEFAEAVADYSAAIRLDPSPPAYYMPRGIAEEMNLDFTAALKDYATAVAADDNDPQAFQLRGRAYAVLGNFALARPDLERSLALSPGEPATLMWLHLAHMRAGEDDAPWLRSHAADVDLTQWPGPAIEYFLGSKSADDMVQIGLTSPDTAKAYQRCDGWFYLGEEALAHGDKAAAAGFFHRTVAGCDALDYEWDVAQAELERLSQQ